MVTLAPAPGRRDDLAAFWDAGVVEEITAQDGAEGFLLLNDAGNDRVIGVSLWASADAADAAGPTFRRHMEAVAPLLAGPPAVTVARVASASVATVGA